MKDSAVRGLSRFPFATAIKETLSGGYSRADLKADLLAGLVVGIVAVPLAMALAIASGVPPQHGLYTAIVAGGLIALAGGSRLSVSGPTAAFVVLLAPISAKYGLSGLLVATLMAGALQLAMGAAGMGRLIQYIPHPVTTGFTAGIAVVIATLQVKDFLGLSLEGSPEHYWERVRDLAAALPTARWPDLATGLATLGILIGWPRVTRAVPAPLAALAAAVLAVPAVRMFAPGFEVATIASRFSWSDGSGIHPGIPPFLPAFTLPWEATTHGEEPVHISFQVVRMLVGPAFAIALLGAIESLLCAVVADGMAGTRHDPDAELVGQGIGNIVAPFLGGVSATAAIARTATNIRSGARSPVAAVIHALFVLAALLGLGPLLGRLPMAALAALLLVVAWNMSEARHFARVLRVAPRSDVLVLLSCFVLTVVFDMVIAVTVGVGLAALLFMQRMADIADVRLVDDGRHPARAKLPEDVLLYEIAGPLFFGAAEKAVGTFSRVPVKARAVLFDMSHVPVMDVTGLIALESAIGKLKKRGMRVILGGVQRQPASVLRRAGVAEEPGALSIFRSMEEALRAASAPSAP